MHNKKTTTTTTTTKTTGNVDLNNLGLGDIASSAASGFDLKSFGLDNPQQNTKTTTTTTITKTSGIPTTSANEFTTDYTLQGTSSSAFGTTQSATSSTSQYNTTKTTTTNIQKSYVAPTQTQSYSYKYSYNIPATTKSTVTKSSYTTGVVPGTNFQ